MAYTRVDSSPEISRGASSIRSRTAATYDLIVLDHPVLGVAAAAPALTPVDEIVSPPELRVWRAETIGRAYDSFNDLGAPRALPIDGRASRCRVGDCLRRRRLEEHAFDDQAMA
ncbi:MAG: hypothetical protein WKF82_02715 [Nocardioidaceae bacterium]